MKRGNVDRRQETRKQEKTRKERKEKLWKGGEEKGRNV